MKQGTPGHPKTEKLMRLLNIKRREAVGILELLWQFTIKYAPGGDVGKYENEDIAAAVDWDGSPANLIEGLVNCGPAGKNGYLEWSKEHRLIVHDWADHAPDYLKKLARKGSLVFALPDPDENGNSLEKNRLESSEEKILKNESGKFQTKTGSQAIPNHTIPSHTKPNQALPSAADADQTDPQTTGVEPVTAGDGGDAPSEPRIENFQTQEPDRASPGLQGKKSHSASDGESGDPWARQRQRLFVQLQTILRLDPLATDKAGQDAYLRAAQAILSQIDQIYADCQAKGKRWEGIEKRLVRFAGETRKDRQKPIANPIGYWLSRCKTEFFTI